MTYESDLNGLTLKDCIIKVLSQCKVEEKAEIAQNLDSNIYYIDLSSDRLKLGNSLLYNVLGKQDCSSPLIIDKAKHVEINKIIDNLVKDKRLLTVCSIGQGGLITTLIEMLGNDPQCGINFYTDGFRLYEETDLVKILFAENTALIIQVADENKDDVERLLEKSKVKYFPIGCPSDLPGLLFMTHGEDVLMLNINAIRKECSNNA